MIEISVLFVPFDATKGHVRRNAGNGVLGYPVFQEGDPFQVPPFVRHTSQATLGEQPGFVMQLNPGSYGRIVTELCLQALSERAATSTASRASVERFLPDVLFLSEQTSEAPFPDQIIIQAQAGIQKDVVYVRIGSTDGTIAVQTIHAYVRSSPHLWSCQHLVKDAGEALEHLLKVTFQGEFAIAGVHLTSKNVGASMAQAQWAFGQLAQFCGGQQIGGVIGDMNLDVAMGGGQVGALPLTRTFIAKDVPAPMGLTQQEQYSSSNNKSHFMGALPFGPVTLQQTLSLRRSSSRFFSDHAPIFADFAWP